LLFLIILPVLCAAQATAAESNRTGYELLAELASVQPVEGFPPALFQPENDPSRFEIAYFLYCFDATLAKTAQGSGLDLNEALARLRLSAGDDSARAKDWADKMALDYRRLLIEYNREMGALGYRLRPDAYPSWSGRNIDVLGN
jgi:hypothetical protein